MLIFAHCNGHFQIPDSDSSSVDDDAYAYMSASAVAPVS